MPCANQLRIKVSAHLKANFIKCLVRSTRLGCADELTRADAERYHPQCLVRTSFGYAEMEFAERSSNAQSARPASDRTGHGLSAHQMAGLWRHQLRINMVTAHAIKCLVRDTGLHADKCLRWYLLIKCLRAKQLRINIHAVTLIKLPCVNQLRINFPSMSASSMPCAEPASEAKHPR